MELIEIKTEFNALKIKLDELTKFLKIDVKNKEVRGIDDLMSKPEIWDNPKKSSTLLKKKKRLEGEIEEIEKLEDKKEELDTYFQLMEEDEELFKEAEKEIESFKENLDNLEVRTYLSGEQDNNNAFLSIHPGAGGTESQDWAEMLLRMYLRYSEISDFKVEIIEVQSGEEAGVKSATIRVEGDYAYGYLKQEVGIHRLVRISPFDSNKRRHTSFASVFVYPEIDDNIEIPIESKDLRVDTYRASGAGGQHVNKTDSAVRITHIPTNIVVQCQSERSQHQNKDRAMQLLKSKLYDLELKKQQEEKDKMESKKGGISWGNQIRSYVLHPYQNVKDHRTGLDAGNAQKVLDGNIFIFIKESLKKGI